MSETSGKSDGATALLWGVLTGLCLTLLMAYAASEGTESKARKRACAEAINLSAPKEVLMAVCK